MVHSRIGASGAKRWMNCPGSVRLNAVLPDTQSKYAAEGTAAHYLGEACLRKTMAYIFGMSNNALVAEGWVPEDLVHWVTQEMKDNVRVYVEAVNALLSVISDLHIEQKFDLEWLYPGMFGTNDACIIEPFGVLDVLDLKYGKGKTVEVLDNVQLMYYALGALHKFAEYDCHTVRTTIVQPRTEHKDGMVRSVTMSAKALRKWGDTVLKPAAEATADPCAPLVSGLWCNSTFCKASRTCPVVVKDIFDVVNPIEMSITEARHLDVDEIGKVLTMKSIIEKWLKDVMGHAQHLMEQGISVPGFKMVAKKSNRAWEDAERTQTLLEAEFGERIYAPRKMLSVAQMEKALGIKEPLQEHWIKPDAGLTLAPFQDKRQEVHINNMLAFDDTTRPL